jgi:hypothetical protein
MGDDVPVDVPTTYYTQLHPCPEACSDKKSPADWTVYSTIDRLQHYDQPILLNFAIFNPLDDPSTGVILKAYTLGSGANVTTNPFVNKTTPSTNGTASSAKIRRRADASSSDCLHSGTGTTADFDLVHSGSSSQNAQDLLAILDGVQSSFQDGAFCSRSSIFGYIKGAAIGVFMGNSFGKAILASAIKSLSSEIKQNGASSSIFTQFCGSSNTS